MPSTAQKNEALTPELSAGHTMKAKVDAGTLAFEFLDLKAQFAPIREEVMAAITRVMESQHFILGSEVRLLEEEVAAKLGGKHAIACASGTDALALAMMAAGIGPGDEVITTPFSFVATAGSIARLGARPVFVDIDPETFNINAEEIEAAITRQTRAILPVHLFGLPADLDPIMRLAESRNLAVIEDAAQAIGARYRDQCVGTIGSFGCFSFFPSKNLGGAGDGGLITTQDDAMADRLRLLRVHGSRKKYHHDILGTNSRLDALQAAILRVKLTHLDVWTRRRQERADRYRALFEAMGLTSLLRVPPVPPTHSHHVYNQFTIRCRDRDSLRAFLGHSGIPTEIYYPLPLHSQPAFAYLGPQSGQFPQAETASQEVLALPVYPELEESQQESVVRAIAEFYAGENV
jgi:dTDP-4-amino-4,6-dideoxygalactose transaminase